MTNSTTVGGLVAVTLLLGACTATELATMRANWGGDPSEYAATRVVWLHDKYTGRNDLVGTIDESSRKIDKCRQAGCMSMTWSEGQPLVRFIWERYDKAENLLPDALNIGFDLAADGAPVAHSDAVQEYKPDASNWADLTVAVAVPVDEFKRLAAVTRFDARVCGHERSFDGAEVAVVKEFARRLSAPADQGAGR